MPYYVRAFCTSNDIPTLSTIFQYASSKGIDLYVDEQHGLVDVNSSDWSQVEISYKKGKSPLVVECNRYDGTQECLARVEPLEFIEKIGSPGFSLTKRRVIKHLKNTQFIISSQLLNDINDDGYNANGTFLTYFVEHCGGMIQADNEGFYDGETLILKVH